MRMNAGDQEFLEHLANGEVGKRLVTLLKNIETHYADIRNLDGADPKVRVEALGILREALLDKLLVLSGSEEAPNGDDYT